MSANVSVLRPLSDIREITEPNLLDSIRHIQSTNRRSSPNPKHTEWRTLQRNPSIESRPASRQSQRTTLHHQRPDQTSSPIRISQDQDDRGPRSNVPNRTVSRRHNHRSNSFTREPAVPYNMPRFKHRAVPNRGQSTSPIKEVIDSDFPNRLNNTRIPSRTIIKVANPSLLDILDHPHHQHPRLRVDLKVAAPLFVGGSSVEGVVRIVIDEAERVRHRKTLTLERISLDLLGIEEVSGAKRHIFMALGNDLVDPSHQPPKEMVESQASVNQLEHSWILVPSVTSLPFLITLPLEVGPPPFRSKHACIRYVLCATLTIKDSGRTFCIRCSQDTAILSVYDPEKALVSLPSPLTASDELLIQCRSSADEIISLTAGLHRQVWVSGTNMFADVQISNCSHKKVKRLELQLERIILCYRHAAAATMEMSASQARLFDQLERTVICKNVFKHGTRGWNGVSGHSAELRTCELEVPRGHATIKCNKYFEIRYYLNVTIGTSHHKLVTVQLPIILIHMNSLDVPTNSVNQVAHAIEEKRAGQASAAATRGSPRVGRQLAGYLQGRAFSAPRYRSLERQRITNDLSQSWVNKENSSPVAGAHRHDLLYKRSTSFTYKTPPSNRKGRVMMDDEVDSLRRQLDQMRMFGSRASNHSVPGSRNHQSRAGSAMGGYIHEAEPGPRDGLEESSRLNVRLHPQRSVELTKPQRESNRWKRHFRS